MLRIAGVLTLLMALYAALFTVNDKLTADIQEGDFGYLIDLANRQGFLAILVIGSGVLIISGGIDLSLGAVMAFSLTLFGVLIQHGVPPLGIEKLHPVTSFLAVVAVGAVIGLVNGTLVTRLKLQPFLVTLCGLFVYRGLARYLTESFEKVGLETLKNHRPEYADSLTRMNESLVGINSDGTLVFPMMLVIALVIAACVGLILHFTVYGRYWYAIGYNESAARYAGINTNRHRVSAYVIASMCAALAGMLYLFDVGDGNPTQVGDTMELQAITAAVIGGCSLRGGEGTIVGMFLGAMVLQLLRPVTMFYGVKDAVIPIVIGITLLFGTLVDEILRRMSSARK